MEARPTASRGHHDSMNCEESLNLSEAASRLRIPFADVFRGVCLFGIAPDFSRKQGVGHQFFYRVSRLPELEAAAHKSKSYPGPVPLPPFTFIKR